MKNITHDTVFGQIAMGVEPQVCLLTHFPCEMMRIRATPHKTGDAGFHFVKQPVAFRYIASCKGRNTILSRAAEGASTWCHLWWQHLASNTHIIAF
jgi:hypothetical protein